jgi:hypothetical protein
LRTYECKVEISRSSVLRLLPPHPDVSAAKRPSCALVGQVAPARGYKAPLDAIRLLVCDSVVVSPKLQQSAGVPGPGNFTTSDKIMKSAYVREAKLFSQRTQIGAVRQQCIQWPVRKRLQSFKTSLTRSPRGPKLQPQGVASSRANQEQLVVYSRAEAQGLSNANLWHSFVLSGAVDPGCHHANPPIVDCLHSSGLYSFCLSDESCMFASIIQSFNEKITGLNLAHFDWHTERGLTVSVSLPNYVPTKAPSQEQNGMSALQTEENKGFS